MNVDTGGKVCEVLNKYQNENPEFEYLNILHCFILSEIKLQHCNVFH